MAQDPLHVLWVEPHFPGRLGAVADWLVQAQGLSVLVLLPHRRPPRALAGVGGAGARGPGLRRRRRGARAGRGLVAHARAQPLLRLRLLGSPRVAQAPAHRPDRRPLRRPRLDALRPGLRSRPRRASTSSTTTSTPARTTWPRRPEPTSPPAYIHWRRSANAVELLDLEQCDLAWTPDPLAAPPLPGRVPRRPLGPARRRRLVAPERVAAVRQARRPGRRSIAGRIVPEGARVVSFVARSLDRLRGFDRFWQYGQSPCCAPRPT